MSERVPPVDAALPALPELLDADSELTQYAATLVGDAAATRRMCHVRYRPGIDCIVAWEFSPEGASPHMVSTRIFRDDRGEDISRRPAFGERAVHAGRSGGGYRYRHREHALIQHPPLDHRLPGLVSAMSTDWARHRLTEYGMGPVDDGLQVELLAGSYKPWVRAVVRYHRRDSASHLGFAKIIRHDDRIPGPDVLGPLDRKLAESNAPWRVAVPAFHDREANLVLLRPVAGAGLDTILDLAIDDVAVAGQLAGYMTQAAEGIGDFQRTGFITDTVVTPETMIAQLERKARRIVGVEPELGDRLLASLELLRDMAAGLPPEPLVPAHGAFRHEHLIADGDRLVAVDLDNLRMSGAGADAGSFLAGLDVAAVLDPRRSRLVEKAGADFRDGLGSATAQEHVWISWYTAEGHLKWAERSVFSLAPNWREVADAMIDLADGLISPAPTSSGVRAC